MIGNLPLSILVWIDKTVSSLYRWAILKSEFINSSVLCPVWTNLNVAFDDSTPWLLLKKVNKVIGNTLGVISGSVRQSWEKNGILCVPSCNLREMIWNDKCIIIIGEIHILKTINYKANTRHTCFGSPVARASFHKPKRPRTSSLVMGVGRTTSSGMSDEWWFMSGHGGGLKDELWMLNVECWMLIYECSCALSS